jgi:hypothetical protein
VRRSLPLKKKFPGLTGTKSSAILFAIVFAAVGGLLVVLTQAATPTANFEAEAGTRSGNVTQVADATASAGSAVKFGTPVAAGACTTKPDSTNTGPTGTLTTDNRTAITTTGEVVENKLFPSSLDIRAANVTLRNVRVIESILVNEKNNVTLDRVKVHGIGVSSSSDVTIQYSHITSFDDDALHITSDGSSYIRNFTIKHSFIERPTFTPGTEAHWDGIQIRGADTVNIYCNNIDAGPWQYPYNVLIYPEPANGGNNNLFIDNNWLNGGNFAIMAGMTNTPMRFEITNNKLRSADFNFGLCFLGGGFTPTTLNQVVQTGNTLDGNPIARVCNESDI